MLDPREGLDEKILQEQPDGVNLARLLPQITRKPFLIGIDGRSGAGKTTLTLQLQHVLSQEHDVTVFHLEDLYPGWEGLDEGMQTYRTRVLEPLRAGEDAHWDTWDWVTSEPGTPRLTRAAEIVLLEGVGACHAQARELLDVSVWIELPEALRKQRALDRDGETYEKFWDIWAAQEEHYIGQDPVWESADILHPGLAPEPQEQTDEQDQ